MKFSKGEFIRYIVSAILILGFSACGSKKNYDEYKADVEFDCKDKNQYDDKAYSDCLYENGI